MVAAAGLLIFQNYWFWYPLINFISLALTPTALITLNQDLKQPQMQFRSNAKPSMFAYPQQLRELLAFIEGRRFGGRGGVTASADTLFMGCVDMYGLCQEVVGYIRLHVQTTV